MDSQEVSLRNQPMWFVSSTELPGKRGSFRQCPSGNDLLEVDLKNCLCSNGQAKKIGQMDTGPTKKPELVKFQPWKSSVEVAQPMFTFTELLDPFLV